MKLVIAAMALATGCGAILNDSTKTAVAPAGVTVDGATGAVPISQKTSHLVQYPDGRTCVITSSAGLGYIIGDILLTACSA